MRMYEHLLLWRHEPEIMVPSMFIVLCADNEGGITFRF